MRRGSCLQRGGLGKPLAAPGLLGALCVLLLLFAVSWPSCAGDTAPGDAKAGDAKAGDAKPGDAKALTAILLSARSALPDSNFADSLVLVMNNLGPAPVGIIVNRPTRFPVADLFPDLKRLASVHDKVYFGGPVEFDTVWFLVRAIRPPAHAVRAFDGIYLSADRDLLMRLLGRDKPMEGLRLFIGHSGWAPGQLEAEIARGDWSLERADPDAIFNNKSQHPWPSHEAPKGST